MIMKAGNEYPSKGFFQIQRNVMASDAFRSLDAYSRCLLFEFMNLYNGHNNGWLEMSHRKAADLLSCSRATADKAISELMDKGFICRIYKGRRISETKKIASRWELTCHAFIDDQGNHRKATEDFRKWKGSPVSLADVQSIDEIHRPFDRKKKAKPEGEIEFGMKALGEAVPIEIEDTAPIRQYIPRTDEEYEDIPF